jgi:S1-C subfamily serine protease
MEINPYSGWGNRIGEMKDLDPSLVDFIVVHITVSDDVPFSTVDGWHRQRTTRGIPWIGGGYHYLVRHDGSIEGGRPIEKQGAQCDGHNWHTVGVVFTSWDGVLTPKQLQSGAYLVKWLMDIFDAKVGRHSDFVVTDCPGHNFPWESFQKEVMNNMFTDVHPSIPQYPHIKRCLDTGLIVGDQSGLFHPDAPMARKDICVMFSKYMFHTCVMTRDLVAKTSRAIVGLYRGKEGGLGTGFFVGPDLIMTNHHVVENGGEISTIGDKEHGTDLVNNQVLQIVNVDPKTNWDFALLRCPVKHDTWLNIWPGDPYEYQHVAIIGTPVGRTYTWGHGIITDSKVPDNPIADAICFCTDVGINPGNSGGPVINGRGEVVGVVRSKWVGMDVENLGFAVRPEYLRQFLTRNKVPF